MISPVFGQLVAYQQPTAFRTVFEDAKPQGYLREAVLAGETVERWTQMITITGHKGLAANPAVTPLSFMDNLGGGFRRACPTTYKGQALTETQISGHDAFIALAGCGTVKSGGAERSETALLIIIKGASDVYSLQWAERGPASPVPPEFDMAMWKKRYESLLPIRLCQIRPGEPAPYPSCLAAKAP